jgi:hypothetical protein
VKEKCEGGVPCRRCTRYRRQCVFNAIPESAERRPRLSFERYFILRIVLATLCPLLILKFFCTDVYANSLEQIGSFSRNDIAEAERVHYLEKIVTHYAPHLALDVISLRDAARNLPVKHQDSDSEGAATQEELDNLGGLALDDEDFTIQTGPNNTTRM